MYRDRVTLRERTGQTPGGVPTYSGTAVTYVSRVRFDPRQIRTPEGEERESRVQVKLAPYIVNAMGEIEKIDQVPSYTPEAELIILTRTLPSGQPMKLAIKNIGEAQDYLGKRQVELFA